MAHDFGTILAACGTAVPHVFSHFVVEWACLPYYMCDNVNGGLNILAGS